MSRLLTFSLLGLAAVLVSCSPAPEPPAPPDQEVTFRGGVIDPTRPRPSFTLTRTTGESFDFARETEGKLTFLFFGYTNCPDICPVHMANLAQVRKTLKPSESQQIRIVFVTADPERDTAEVLDTWLGRIGGDIIGLTGTMDEILRAHEAARVPPPVKEGEGPNYAVGHMAWVIGITPDDEVRLLYPFGMRQEDWAHDIPRLLSSYPAR
ncbi:MAG TPA: SCO family protein [Gemmatimonadales bacterium]|nr:SCO family protein [Gemmatimonadales bacterium]